MSYDCAVTGGRVVLPYMGVFDQTVAIRGGRVSALLDPADQVEAAEIIDARGLHVFPGGIDPHTHIVWMGRPIDYYASETRGAAVGGVTTLFNYLVGKDPLDAQYEEHRAAADPRVYVDYAFHFDGMGETQLERLSHYLQAYGVSSFKYFTNVKEFDAQRRGSAMANDGYLVDLMTALARIPGAVLEIHVENPEICERFEGRARTSGRTDQASYNEGRPPLAEGEAALRVCYLALKTGCRIHLVHVSTGDALDAVRHFRRQGARISLEVSHSHFTLDCDTTDQLTLKSPPIRGFDDLVAVQASMLDGTADCIASDHGVAGKIRSERTTVWNSTHAHPVLPFWLPLLFSEMVHKRGMDLVRAAEISSANTARIFNLYPRKGTLLPGSDADLVLVDMEKEQVVDPTDMEADADFALWEGWTLKGWPVRTLVRGRTVMVDGRIVGQPGWGQYLRRDPRPTT